MDTLRSIAAIPCGLLVAGVVFLCLDSTGQMLEWPRHPLFPVFAAFCIAVSIVAAFFVARAMAGLRSGASTLLLRMPRFVLAGVVIAYLLSWTFGIPAVLTAQQTEAVDAYKMERGRNNRVWEAHPWIRTTIAFPLLPGLVVSYHEYQVAGLNGWGGWQVHVWYVLGVRQVFERTHWVS